MAFGRLSAPDRALTYAVLLAGAVVFSFPFLWMVGTSIKVEREMAADRLTLFPHPPHPQPATPYIDRTEFAPPTVPDGVPAKVWGAAKPQIERVLLDRLSTWPPRLPATEDTADAARSNTNAYTREMVEGLFDMLAARMSDDARRAAVAAERTARGNPAGDDRALTATLSPAAITSGADALVREAARLVDERTLEETLDRCYRRFTLGECRVQTRDYQTHVLAAGTEWKVLNGDATVEPGDERGAPLCLAKIRYSRGSPAVTFGFDRELPFPADAIERVYIGYRGDATWARARIRVVLGGKLYETTDIINMEERDGVEQELRWPTDTYDEMDLRTYLFLREVGPAPADSPPFGVRFRLTRNSTVGAWYDKALHNYRTVFREVPFTRYIMTSLAISILCIVLTIFACTLVGYAFARLQWPGRDLLFGVMLATMMIPPQVTMIPAFLLIRYIGWYNTLMPLWIFSAFGTPFFIFLLRQFFKTIPQDLEDAARIDGCSFLGIYWHVMLPLVKPTVATIAIYTFMGTWNNFMGPLIYLNDDRLFPLAIGLFKFNLRSGTDVGLMMAGAFIMCLPILVFFFFLQRYFIQGISLTGMKG